jgi:TolA-binding protein
MKTALVLTLSVLLTSSWFAAAQTESSGTAKRKTSAKATVSRESKLDRLEQAVAAQQQQIQQLRQDVQQRDQTIQQMQQYMDQARSASSAATEAQSKADAAAMQTSKLQDDVSTLRGDVSDLKQNSTNTALTLQETQKSISALESPLAIHFKGITITPGGFLAAETVFRNRALAADVNTPFNSLTLPGATQNHLTEFFGSGRQSRISMLGEGKLKSAKLSGYYEADFLSAGVTSNNNESNSYTLRQRQAWGQAALESGWTFTGGQMWSLVTETKKGLDNRSEALPMTIDPQYTAGFSWARQYGFRLTKNFGNKMWLGFAAENSQATLTAHGNSNNFVLGAAGASGGLYNPSATYSFNLSPDIVAKAAFEPGFGHYEVFGVFASFHDRIFPCANTTVTGICAGVTGPSAAGAFNNSAASGGIGANARVSLADKHLDIGAHVLGGKGMGRYGTVGLPDVTVRPDGAVVLLRNYQALGTIELHYPKFDVYFNGGGEYAGRASSLNAAGKPVGYGAPQFNNTGCFTETPPGTPTAGQFPTSSNGFVPGSLANCTGDTRILIEGTAGFWYRFYNGPKGRLQFGPQYSYLVRNTWVGKGGEPHGIDNMVLTSFRYYLP